MKRARVLLGLWRPLCVAWAMALLLCLLAMPARAHAADTPHVTQHSKAEIMSYLAQSGTSQSDPVTYAVNPVKNNQMGELSEATKQSALAELNNVRYIAGLDPVTLSDEYGRKAQAGAFSNYCIGKLTHYPATDGTQPEGMSDELWALGGEGASHSNISYGQNLNPAIRHGWMADEDKGNIARVGHRNWCLNPEMASTGFGQAGVYGAMYSADTGNAAASQSNVVWPAQLMPVEFFDPTYPWSIMTGTNISDPSAISVTITKQGDGTTWTLDSSDTVTPASTSSAYFAVYGNLYTGYAGQPGCIIFRPANFSYEAGDVFHVVASGVNGSTIEYDVEFFSGYPVESMSFAEPVQYLTYSSTTIRPTVNPSDASGYQIEWSSSDESIVTVTPSASTAYATARSVNPGRATVTATIAGRYTADGEPLTTTVEVVVPKDFRNCGVFEISGESLEYTGSPIRPIVTVSDNDTGEVLVEDEDYTVEVEDEIIEPGEGTTLLIYGKNAYKNGRSTYITVTKRSIREDMVTLEPASLPYTGASQKPTVSVAYGDLTLVEGTDYTLTNDGGTNIGTYDVIVRGTGSHFTGSCAASYAIEPVTLAASMLEVGPTELVYTGARQYPRITLTYQGNTLVEGTDYTCSGDAIEAGTHTLTITGTGNFQGELTADFTIVPASVAVKDGKQIAATNTLTYGQTLASLTYENAAFVIEGTDTIVSGTFAFDDADAVLPAGTHEVAWTFVPSDANCQSLAGTLQVTVNQATPELSAPPAADAVAYRPSLALSDVALSPGEVSVSGAWVWDDATTRLSVPGGSYGCHFVPDDAGNYKGLDAQVAVTVNKGTPYVASLEMDALTYGQRLADVVPTAVVQCAEDDATPLAGTLSWVDGQLAPSVGDSGITDYELRFVPEDTANYEQLSIKTKVTVNKAARPDVMPPTELNVSFGTATLTNDLLASYEGWEFEPASVGTELEVEATRSFTAVYVADDVDCFEQTTAEVAITRSSCDHEHTEVRGAKEPTCTEEGATGDTYCTVCGALLEPSAPIAMTEHVWDKEQARVAVVPTCITEGEMITPCKHCDAKNSEPIPIDPTNHTHPVTVDLVQATMEADGRTEETYCADCGEIITPGDTIPRVTSVSLESDELPWTGSAQQPEVLVVAGDNRLYEGIEYEVACDEAVSRGTYNVTIKGINKYHFTVSKSFTIVAREVTPSITLAPASFTFDGSQHQPEVTVKDGSKVLELGTDYYLDLLEQGIEVGSYEVRVTLFGNYRGSGTATYHIEKARPTIEASEALTVAMGKTVRVDATVSEGAGELSYATSDAKVATVGADGTVRPVSVGQATITVSAAESERYGAASAQVKLTVTKGSQPMAAKAKKAKVNVKLKAVKKKAKTLANNLVITNAQGTKSFKNVSSGKAKKIKVNGKTGKLTVPKGTKKGTYTVKVKVTAKGNANWNAGSKTVRFKVVVK